MPVEVAGVDRRPPAIGASNGVGDEHMSVEVRIPGATGPVTEGGSDEPVPSDLFDTTMTSPRPRGVPLQVAERVGVDLARQPEQGGPGAQPAAGSLALEVVVLHATSDRVEVVALDRKSVV